MMQTVIVMLLVGAASWHVGKRLYKMLRGLGSGKGGCETSCGMCPASEQGNQPAVVSVSSMMIRH
jgi:hypothetical protein